VRELVRADVQAGEGLVRGAVAVPELELRVTVESQARGVVHRARDRRSVVRPDLATVVVEGVAAVDILEVVEDEPQVAVPGRLLFLRGRVEETVRVTDQGSGGVVALDASGARDVHEQVRGVGRAGAALQVRDVEVERVAVVVLTAPGLRGVVGERVSDAVSLDERQLEQRAVVSVDHEDVPPVFHADPLLVGEVGTVGGGLDDEPSGAQRNRSGG
jgi:hypothetical protein